MKNEKSKFWVVEDDDTGDVKLFKSKERAIDYAYDKCQQWGSILCIFVKDYTGDRYISLGNFGNREDQLNLLYRSTVTELNDTFEAYWYFQEVEVEDE